MRTSDREFFRYFPISPQDRQWGIYVTGVGSTHVPPYTRSYPVREHPNPYMYTWERGRVLHEYQALYIVDGKGCFESTHRGTQDVNAGAVFLLFPGEWHRYRPATESGWDEYWVSFAGSWVDGVVAEGFFSPKQPVLATGVDETIQHAYLDLLDRARAEPIGYQQLNAASVQEILAGSLAAVRRQRLGGRGDEVVRLAKVALEEQLEGVISIAKLAASLHLSEERLRRLFRQHTGMSPYQYYLELKIHRARQLLRETDLPIKTIAHTLGFESQFHFAKAFKQRTGITPAQWRRGEIPRPLNPA
jgi:AraC-like DNA-binding protein